MDSFKTLNFDSEKNYFRNDPNEGNFLGMVKLLAGENKNLAQHLKTLQEHENAGHRNQITLLSNNFVNNSLFIIRNFLVHSIVDEINGGGGTVRPNDGRFPRHYVSRANCTRREICG